MENNTNVLDTHADVTADQATLALNLIARLKSESIDLDFNEEVVVEAVAKSGWPTPQQFEVVMNAAKKLDQPRPKENLAPTAPAAEKSDEQKALDEMGAQKCPDGSYVVPFYRLGEDGEIVSIPMSIAGWIAARKAMVQAQAKRLTFGKLRDANRRRLPLFKNRAGQVAHEKADGSDWNIAEWMNAVAGEVGEACNYAKKLRRGDFGEPGSAAYRQGELLLLDEIADFVVYGDLAAMQAHGDLGQAVIKKFNEVSDRVGCDVKL